MRQAERSLRICKTEGCYMVKNVLKETWTELVGTGAAVVGVYVVGIEFWHLGLAAAVVFIVRGYKRVI